MAMAILRLYLLLYKIELNTIILEDADTVSWIIVNEPVAGTDFANKKVIR
jgi:hypothetical protein